MSAVSAAAVQEGMKAAPQMTCLKILVTNVTEVQDVDGTG